MDENLVPMSWWQRGTSDSYKRVTLLDCKIVWLVLASNAGVDIGTAGRSTLAFYMPGVR